MPLQMPEAHQEAQLHCPGIDRNADDWAVVSISALYGASAAAYAEKTRLRMWPNLLEPAILALK